MPTYPYQCPQCQSKTEQTHGASERIKLACSHCGGILQKTLNTDIAIHLNSKPEPEKSTEPHQHDEHCKHNHPEGQSCIMDATKSDKNWNDFIGWLEKPKK